MMKIEDITPGNSYACKFKVETMLDTYGRIPGLSDTPLKGVGTYEGLGILVARDMDKRLVELQDEKSSKKFVIPFEDIWDIDEVEWTDPLDPKN
ncbi:MAG: hypothetical protein CMQ88_02205 [Gammaproteobacteria bacterium]|nr:hypothetical protein [Gammaproteobacteria bacterium]|tara:strand:+ start:429 stop:710 length:282 start_codon:yes stop_codon:yes gene_type:complete